MGFRRGGVDWDAVALWAPVVCVGVLVQGAVGLEYPWSGSDLGLAVSAVLLAAPLAVRRRLPLVTAGIVAAALPLQVLLGGSLGFGSFVAVLLAAYSAGRWTRHSRRLLPVGPVVLLGGALAAQSRLADNALGELVFPVFYVVAATTVGATIRRLADQSTELRRLNEALAEQVDLTARLAVSGERNRISRDLHDSVAHTLMVTVVQAEAAEQALDTDPDAARTALVRIQENGRAGLAELRDTLRVLRSQADDRARRLADLPALAAVLADSGLEVDLDLGPESGRSDGIPPDLSADLYRVAQEGLTNVMKHSTARSATVRLRCEDGRTVLLVTDPGPPAAADRQSGGHGLAGMAERLASYGGTVTAGPPPAGAGWTVRAEVPA